MTNKGQVDPDRLSIGDGIAISALLVFALVWGVGGFHAVDLEELLGPKFWEDDGWLRTAFSIAVWLFPVYWAGERITDIIYSRRRRS